MATAVRAKAGLAIRAEAAHQRTSRASMVPRKTRTNRILKDRAKEQKSSERGIRGELVPLIRSLVLAVLNHPKIGINANIYRRWTIMIPKSIIALWVSAALTGVTLAGDPHTS